MSIGDDFADRDDRWMAEQEALDRGRLFAPPPAAVKSPLVEILELSESVLASEEYDAFQEGLKRIRRICLRSIGTSHGL